MKVYIISIVINTLIENSLNYPFFMDGELPFSDNIQITPKIMYSENNIFEYGTYGFSSNKNITDEFVSQRRKDIFYTKKIHMSKDEYEEFCKKYQRFELKKYPYDKTSVVSTEFEYQNTMDGYVETIYKKFADVEYIPFNNFNKKIREALELLCGDIIFSDNDSGEFDMYEGTSWKYDALSVFLELFGNTFEKGL